MNTAVHGIAGTLAIVAALGLMWCGTIVAQDEGASPHDKAQDVGDWIHEDIEAGYAAARETGKPLLVAFR